MISRKSAVRGTASIPAPEIGSLLSALEVTAENDFRIVANLTSAVIV